MRRGRKPPTHTYVAIISLTLRPAELKRPAWMQIRLFSWLPKMSIRRIIQIPRPSSSTYTRPITAHLFFAPHASKLAESTELILDIPGGGFVSMTPEHHEERLCAWAEKTGRPVLSVDYGKAPECEYSLL